MTPTNEATIVEAIRTAIEAVVPRTEPAKKFVYTADRTNGNELRSFRIDMSPGTYTHERAGSGDTFMTEFNIVVSYAHREDLIEPLVAEDQRLIWDSLVDLVDPTVAGIIRWSVPDPMYEITDERGRAEATLDFECHYLSQSRRYGP